jgi:hypothetical protein
LDPAPVDLDSQQLLETDVAELDDGAEMVDRQSLQTLRSSVGDDGSLFQRRAIVRIP